MTNYYLLKQIKSFFSIFYFTVNRKKNIKYLQLVHNTRKILYTAINNHKYKCIALIIITLMNSNLFLRVFKYFLHQFSVVNVHLQYTLDNVYTNLK